MRRWGSWEEHVQSYWEHRERSDVLFVKYEDIKADHAGEVRRIAEFLGLSLKLEQIAEARGRERSLAGRLRPLCAGALRVGRGSGFCWFCGEAAR